MRMGILVDAEVATAVGTITLSIVTVAITLYQIKKIHKEKIEEWRRSHLDSHYSRISEEIKTIEKQISDNEGDDNRGFEQLFTPRNHWIMTNRSLSVIDNKKLEIKCLIERDRNALHHIDSGYPEIVNEITQIN